MSNLEIWFLGVALAMDCFTVSIAAGISARRIILWPMVTMIVAFGLFQGGMTMIGYYGISIFNDYLQTIDHWIAASLLGYLGIRMIVESRKEEEEKSFQLLNYKVIPTMAIATSIDALAVGISFGCLQSEQIINIWYPVSVIALCSSLFTIVGLCLGIKLGKNINMPVEAIGGLVLIFIGIKILIEHIC